MKPQPLILAIFFFVLTGYAQETGWVFADKEKKDVSTNPGFTVAIAPLALIDIFDAPSVRLSAEIPLNNRIAIGAEGGFVFFESMYKQKPGGFTVKPILKYYLNPKNNNMRYFAEEYMYKEQHYYLTDSLKNNEDVRYKKTYNMDRKAVAFSLKYGQVSEWKGAFDIEWFVGGGIRFQKSVSDLTPQEERWVLTGLDSETGTDHGDSMVAGMLRQSGVYVYPNITAGLKLMFNFRRFKKRVR